MKKREKGDYKRNWDKQREDLRKNLSETKEKSKTHSE